MLYAAVLYAYPRAASLQFRGSREVIRVTHSRRVLPLPPARQLLRIPPAYQLFNVGKRWACCRIVGPCCGQKGPKEVRALGGNRRAESACGNLGRHLPPAKPFVQRLQRTDLPRHYCETEHIDALAVPVGVKHLGSHLCGVGAGHWERE